MSDAAAIRRQLKIKSGAVKRLMKEHNLYKKEAETQQRSVDKHAAEGADEWEMRNQEKLLAEAQKMVPEAQRVLGAAVVDLRELVVRAKSEPGMQEDEELMKAEEALGEASV